MQYAHWLMVAGAVLAVLDDPNEAYEVVPTEPDHMGLQRVGGPPSGTAFR